jgi:hypothetical protein
MPSTNTLSRSISVAQNFLKNAPLTGIGGNPLEPAASIGDYTRQFMLAPPFGWRWNRVTTTFNTVAGTQDYTKVLTNFGWLESASTNDNLGSAGSIVAMQNRLNESEDGSQSRPRYISARLDDDTGDITFRLLPTPDTVYTVSVTYQKAAPSFANLSDTWSPLPDFMSNLYNYGFRAFAYEYFDDPRFSFTFQMFLRQLVSASEGLSETQRSIYLADFLSNAREQQAVGVRTQLAQQGRSGY